MKNKIYNLNEQSIEKFVNDSHLCIYCLDAKTKKIIFANPSFYKLLGYLPEEGENLTLYDFINHSKESIDSFIDLVIQTKQRNTGEREWKSKEGKIIDMFVNVSHGDHKDVDIIYVSAQNISERKQVERELQKSQHFLNESQRVSKIGSYITDLKSGTWKGSDELKRIFGLTAPESYTVECWQSIIHPEHKKMLLEYLELEVIGKKQRFDKEYKIINQKTQEELWVHGIGELEFDNNDNPIKMVGTIQDITERKQSQQEIIETENKFKSVVKSAKDSIVLANEKGEIIFWNHCAEKIFGYTENEVYGKPLTILMPEKFRQAHQEGFKNHVLTNQDTDKDNTMELFGLKKNGKEFPIELSLSHWKNGNEKFYCGIIRDISERKNAENQQRKHFKKLSDIAFLHSHHVRAPIASILGLIELINFENPEDPKNIEIFYHLKKTSLMCDSVIKEIIEKTTEIEELSKIF
ncbi:MAG: hypothetical protein A3F72_13940 [Bacteroidetes bacterium RIFCSPLOWO2_12_FULL_35_15]|nr:MAG: hypothetical protein A3F72_13940 [Bacteroidetes bacterium RIFCSPLOWO2_12_FULL_35_15]